MTKNQVGDKAIPGFDNGKILYFLTDLCIIFVERVCLYENSRKNAF